MSPPASAAGAQALPFHLRTCPLVAPAVLTSDKALIDSEPRVNVVSTSSAAVQEEPLYLRTCPEVTPVVSTSLMFVRLKSFPLASSMYHSELTPVYLAVRYASVVVISESLKADP